jgi:hypothetical protein
LAATSNQMLKTVFKNSRVMLLRDAAALNALVLIKLFIVFFRQYKFINKKKQKNKLIFIFYKTIGLLTLAVMAVIWKLNFVQVEHGHIFFAI